MKLRITIIIAALFTVLFMATCGDDNPSAPEPDPDPPTNPNLVTREIGPAGGTITSSDSKMTLIIPEGALSGTETISVETITAGDLGPEFDQISEMIGIENAYEMGPDGLEFNVPATVRFESEQSPITKADTLGIFSEFLFTNGENGIELLDSLKTTFNADDGSVTISGQTDHFTPIVNGFGGQENNGVQFFVTNIPDMAEVDDPFEIEAAISDDNTGPSGDLVAVLGPAKYLDKSAEPVVSAFEGAPESEMEIGNDFIRFFGFFSYTCSTTGLGVYESEISAKVRFNLESGPVEAESFANFITTEMFTLTVDKEGDGNGTVVSDPEGIDCGSDCDSDNADFEEESGVILAATAADGSVFDGWSGDIPAACEDSTDPCTLTMDTDKNVTATFSIAEEQAVATRIVDFNRLELTAEFVIETEIMTGGSAEDVELELNTGDGNSIMTEIGEEIDGKYQKLITHIYDQPGEYEINLSAKYRGNFADEFTMNFTTAAPPEIVNIEAEFTDIRVVLFNFIMSWVGPHDNLNATFDGDGDGANKIDVQLEEGFEKGTIMGKITHEFRAESEFPNQLNFEVTNTESGNSIKEFLDVLESTLNVASDGDGAGTVKGNVFISSELFTEVINCEPDCDESVLYLPPSLIFPGLLFPIVLESFPDNGNVFGGWNGDLEEASDCDPPGEDCIGFFMDRDRNVTATFVKKETATALILGLISLQGIEIKKVDGITSLNGGSDSDKTLKAPPSSNSIVNNTDNVSFGSISGTFPVAVAGTEGFVVVDLLTEEVLMNETGFSNTGPFFGVAGVTQNLQVANSPAVLEAFGQNGSVFKRFDKFGSIAGSSTTFDIFPAGGNVVSDVMTIVRPLREIDFWVFDANQGIYVTAESSAEFDDGLFDGELVSAYMHSDVLSDNVVPQPRGSFLVLTRGTESKLYLATWDPKAVTEVVSNIGFDARKIRCTGDGSGTGNLVCAVSVFGDSRLAILTWNGQNEPVLTGFVDVGNGPVGIDLRSLANGNVAIVSTGFNDNTVTETEVSAGGNIISNNTRPVLDGCQSPGHAIYIQDDESLKVVGTCFGSDAIFIMESEF